MLSYRQKPISDLKNWMSSSTNTEHSIQGNFKSNVVQKLSKICDKFGRLSFLVTFPKLCHCHLVGPNCDVMFRLFCSSFTSMTHFNTYFPAPLLRKPATSSSSNSCNWSESPKHAFTLQINWILDDSHSASLVRTLVRGTYYTSNIGSHQTKKSQDPKYETQSTTKSL